MFLRNYWYVAAWSHEVGREPLQRWLLGEPLVMWRREDGTPAAVADRCPHRGAPLSTGCIVGDDIQCGYHGLRFDGGGACVGMPGAPKIPGGLSTRAYPMVEKWGWVFAWMGDPDKADEAELPDYHWKNDPDWTGRGETLPVAVNYTLVRDNLLDLSHAHFVHQKTLATDAVVDVPVETEFDGKAVRVIRDMRGIEPSPFFKRLGGFNDKVDHHQVVEFTPAANIVIKVTVRSAANPDHSIGMRVLNAMTPETEGTTHYFWSLERNTKLDDAELTDAMFTANRDTFFEDVTVIEAQQKYLDRAPAPERPIRWHIDKGVDQVQRWVDKLVREEQAGSIGGSTGGAGTRP
ncbi:MAG: aromatic ring-hydroxylating dioxygenase subunit alpha [Bauldia litoralis]